MADVQSGLTQIVDFITAYAVTLMGLGIVTMAILEAAKKLFNLRQIFQRNALESWLGEAHSQRQAANHYVAPGGGDQPRSGYLWRKAYAELLHLTTGLAMQTEQAAAANRRVAFSRSVEFALFELELPQLMGQLQDAADTALNHPQRFPEYFAFLTRGCDAGDVARWRAAASGAAPTSDDERKALGELYARIRLLVRRQLDTFQTVTAYRWREWNQLYGWLLGGVLMFAAQVLASVSKTGTPPESWLKVFAVSLLGGLLAPVAKDLVDALSKFKR